MLNSTSDCYVSISDCTKQTFFVQEIFDTALWLSLLFFKGLAIFSSLIWISLLFPMVSATPSETSFPDISFREFSQFIGNNFSKKVSLATVLVVLFSTTCNSDLLNLHARQQNPQLDNEISQTISGWMKAFARALDERLGTDSKRLFKKHELKSNLEDDQRLTLIGMKLNGLSKLIGMDPYYRDESGRIMCKPLKVISEKEIEPVHLICPISMHCSSAQCEKRALLLDTRDRDVPRVTLIKGTKFYPECHLLSGMCTNCGTRYYGDHESSAEDKAGPKSRWYLNNAKYMKAGSNLWVDRVFSGAVVNGTYSFHASTSAYAEFFNDSFWNQQNPTVKKLSRRQVWHTFVQETLRQVAKSARRTLELEDDLPIDKVTKEAYKILGEDGIIRSAQNHHCSECTHEYRHTADIIPDHDPASLLGVDENRNVPALSIEVPPPLPADATPQARLEAARFDAARVEADTINVRANPLPQGEAHNPAPVKMVVLDGIVMGPTVKEERLPWLPNLTRPVQLHDDETQTSNTSRNNYFTAAQFYCVETICAPCGVVLAWTKFDKSESPSKILNFLASVFPTESVRPNYICIDKACAVLRTAIVNGSWDTWKKTTRFIVDSYHYINHRVQDWVCRKWCNPAPLNGSAPNLVIIEHDNNGVPHYKRAFNTQACEQLNAWIGGFQTVLNKMTIGNFDWSLHALLFIHTQRVIKAQMDKLERQQRSEEEKKKKKKVEEEESDTEAEGFDIDRE
ncbi:hypothetical protein BD410DRAFT_735206 [Rickenella mellea]|uniref:CxC5 like cysteine cluster associated with KDZ domain-containing protein n=1 Tax=Rickenella mellea TaxID=50990 RepID=A0A4Y7PE26_9AGAM|nr:hypothetical protein BD410DRAFT_735206 [Rickenella mellea]